MKRKAIVLLLASLLLLTLTACGCEHTWEDATCLEPAVCKECGETQGEPAGHIWQEATCDAPKTCTSCGITEGDKTEHQWLEATCQAPKTCELCNATEGELAEHNWSAICRAECTVCGVDNPESNGHTWNIISDMRKWCTYCQKEEITEHTCNWVETTCSFPKYCTLCLTEEVEPLGHTLVNDEVISRCETCQKDIEVFRDVKGKSRYFTEFETAADGTYTNPITAMGNGAIQWYENGKQSALKFWDTFCVDNKIYYLGSLLYEVSANTREDLIAAAQKHINYQYAKFYEDKEQDTLFLASKKMLTDDQGQVYAVVDVYGERYILIHKGQPGSNLEDTVVIKADWRS